MIRITTVEHGDPVLVNTAHIVAVAQDWRNPDWSLVFTTSGTYRARQSVDDIQAMIEQEEIVSARRRSR